MENGKWEIGHNHYTTALRYHSRRSFTLIEAIFVIIILSFVLIGGFQIVSKLYVRNYLAKTATKFEFTSQQTLDQLSGMLYYRVPLSVIGYDQQNNKYKYIGEITENEHYPILEWIGYLNDAMVDSNLSGFVDLYESKKPVIKTVDFNSDFINNILKNKFNTNKSLKDLTGIVFAGSFDRGDEESLSNYKNAFGWHGGKAMYVYKISKFVQHNNNAFLTLKNYDNSNITHATIYEKFYLVDSAYALALKKDLDKNKWHCNDVSWDEIDDNDLLLFYNYRPWKGETFCGDGGDGNVSVLALNVNSFWIKKVNSHLELKIEMLKSKGDINVSISKQKVSF